MIFLLFHGELNTRLLAIQMLVEVMQLILPMWPNDNCVIHVEAAFAKPTSLHPLAVIVYISTDKGDMVHAYTCICVWFCICGCAELHAFLFVLIHIYLH